MIHVLIEAAWAREDSRTPQYVIPIFGTIAHHSYEAEVSTDLQY